MITKHALDSVARLLGRANQALQTLERYRDRLDSVTSYLSALEVEDLVTVRDVVTVLQRAEMVRRIAEEIEGYIVELGTDGRLVLLQLEELMAGVEDERRHVVCDYLPEDDADRAGRGGGRSGSLATERLLCPQSVASVLELGEGRDLESEPAAAGLPAPVAHPASAGGGDRRHRRPIREPAEGHAGRRSTI